MKTAAFALLLALHPLSASVFSGQVLEDHSSAPLRRATIRIYSPSAAGMIAELETDLQGRFRSPELPDGAYRLEVSKPNYSPVEVRLQPRSGLLLRLIRHGAIAGRILDSESHPVASATIGALSPFGGLAGHAEMNGNAGEYRIYGLPPGRYTVVLLSAANGRGALFYPDNSQPREFLVAGGEEYNGIDFALTGAKAFSIKGKVEMPERQLGAYSLLSADHPGLQVAVGPASSQDGTFRIDRILPGAYDFLVSQGSQLYGRTRLTVTAEDVENLVVPMTPGRSVSFSLRAGDPKCGSDGVVSLLPMERWMATPETSAPVAAQKAVTFSKLPPGRFRATVKSRNGCYGTTQPVLNLDRDVPTDPIELELAPAGSLHGSVTGALRPEEVTVVLIPLDGSPLRIAFPHADSHYAFEDLVPGSYYVTAAAGATTRWMPSQLPTPTQVSAGPPTQSDLRLPEVSR